MTRQFLKPLIQYIFSITSKEIHIKHGYPLVVAFSVLQVTILTILYELLFSNDIFIPLSFFYHLHFDYLLDLL